MSRNRLRLNLGKIFIAAASGGGGEIPPTSGTVETGVVIGGTIDAVSTCNEGLTWDIEETGAGFAVSFTFSVSNKGQQFKGKGKASKLQDYIFRAWNGSGWDALDTFSIDTTEGTYAVAVDEAYTIGNEVKIQIYRATGTNEKLYLDCVTILDEVPPSNARIIDDAQGRITTAGGWRVVDSFENLSVVASPDYSTEIEVYDTVSGTNKRLSLAQLATLMSGVGVIAKHTGGGALGNNVPTPFDADVYDPLGFHDLGDNTKLTVPSGYAGRYVIVGSLRSTTGTSSAKTLQIYKNGVYAGWYERKESAGANALGNYVIVGELSLAEGDYVQLWANNQLKVMDSTGISFAMWRIRDD